MSEMPAVPEPEFPADVIETEEVVETEVAPATEEEFSELIDEAEEFAPPDPDQVITIRASGGKAYYVPSAEGMTVSQTLAAANLTTNGVVEFWLNGAQVAFDTFLPSGSKLMVVGSLKGG